MTPPQKLTSSTIDRAATIIVAFSTISMFSGLALLVPLPDPPGFKLLLAALNITLSIFLASAAACLLISTNLQRIIVLFDNEKP